jgi:rhodanese-related sulfurtransferase
LKAAELLASQGWTELVNLAGGYGAWARAGQAVEKEAPGRSWEEMKKK